MYINNLRRLRQENDLTQEQLCNKLNFNRNTYNNWERGIVMIPLEVADSLSLYYKTTLSCILGITKNIEYNNKIKKLNYEFLLNELTKMKNKNKNTYDEIGTYLKCTGATCQRYFKGKFTIPVDRLILLAELYDTTIDKLCGKE